MILGDLAPMTTGAIYSGLPFSDISTYVPISNRMTRDAAIAYRELSKKDYMRANGIKLDFYYDGDWSECKKSFIVCNVHRNSHLLHLQRGEDIRISEALNNFMYENNNMSLISPEPSMAVKDTSDFTIQIMCQKYEWKSMEAKFKGDLINQIIREDETFRFKDAKTIFEQINNLFGTKLDVKHSMHKLKHHDSISLDPTELPEIQSYCLMINMLCYSIAKEVAAWLKKRLLVLQYECSEFSQRKILIAQKVILDIVCLKKHIDFTRIDIRNKSNTRLPVPLQCNNMRIVKVQQENKEETLPKRLIYLMKEENALNPFSFEAFGSKIKTTGVFIMFICAGDLPISPNTSFLRRYILTPLQSICH